MNAKKNNSITPMNQWVSDLVQASGLTGPAAAEILNQAVGSGYNRTALYKMQRFRRVTVMEDLALSRATGFPLPDEVKSVASYDDRWAGLSPKRRAMLDQLLADFEAAEAREREADPLDTGGQDGET